MWLGLGLSLDEFVKLGTNEQQRRLCELSDVDQLLFVERHLDHIAAILQGFPPESMLPVLPPPGYRSRNGNVIVFQGDAPHVPPERLQ